MNWDQLTDECCQDQGCTDQHIAMAMSGPYSPIITRTMRHKQQDVRRVATAVRQAYEANPTATQAELRKQTYKFLIGGVFLSFLIQALLSSVVKLAVEWFLRRIFNSQEGNHGGIPLSAE
jgi:ABC-type transporter Mla subunit MlaD